MQDKAITKIRRGHWEEYRNSGKAPRPGPVGPCGLFGIPKLIPPLVELEFIEPVESLYSFRKARPPEFDGVSYVGRFTGLMGASSSSLKVRSITALAGRLLLLDGRAVDDVTDCSLDEEGGVRCEPGFCGCASCLSVLTRESWISTISSSSSGV